MASFGFNRDIVECKEQAQPELELVEKDLIETLWNVKKTSSLKNKPLLLDLIETLWNVKLAKKPDEVGGYRRFNRDIVECKGWRTRNNRRRRR